MGYRGMGHMGIGVQGYEAHVWAMRYRGMGHRGMGHMGNGVQGYGAHRQWGTGCRDMGHMYGEGGTGVWDTGV